MTETGSSRARVCVGRAPPGTVSEDRSRIRSDQVVCLLTVPGAGNRAREA
jgi:hypothetical protein